MEKGITISIGDKYTNYLCGKDEDLCKLIKVIDSYTLNLDTNYYESLVKRIISQQLSLKAASTIISRVVNICNTITPQSINVISDIELRSCGLSNQKITYIRHLTDRVLVGDLDLMKLSYDNDLNVINSLTQIKGIGIWTAEMFLIFSLGRENILSSSDVSIRNAIKWLHQINIEELDWGIFQRLWSPYNTIASLYLWEIINRNYAKDYRNINELYETMH